MADSALSAAPETPSEERNDLPPLRESRPLPNHAQILRRIEFEDALRGPAEPVVQPALEPGGIPIPFLQAERNQSPAGAALSAEEVERRAKEMAAEVDRRLAREQPDLPKFPPVRSEVREPVVTGSTALPFYSALVDPARITGARHREIKGIEPRTTECVACEYRKLDTRLGDPAALGIDEKTLTPAQRQHFGYGERLYNLCQLCHDANGMLHPVLFDRLVVERMHEDRQRTFRFDPAFADIAERVAAVDSWRRGVAGVEELGSVVRESQSLADARAAMLDDGGEYDGRDLDDQVMRLSDFTGQTPGESRGSPGNPDPLFSQHDAHYDPARIGADEAAAYLMDEQWEARRKENFRRAWAATDEIEDPALRHQVRARLVERWDPRMGLAGEDRMVEVNLFAEPSPRLAPYARSATHSGVDEGFSSEPEWKKNALARHEAAVGRFMSTVRGKLAGQGLPVEKIQELTALPELNPGREIIKFRHESPLRQRIAEARGPGGPLEEWTTPEGKKVWGRVVLPPKADLEVAVAEGELRRSVMDAVNHIGNLEAARGQVDADTFLLMARRVQLHQELQARVREANERREEVQRWSGLMHRADEELQGASRSFAREIRETFRDPKAFQSAFTRLSDEQKRHALQVLRERPGEFARTFANSYGHDFGKAGELATGREQRSSAVTEIERAGVLTAEAGGRYLDAVRSRRIVTANVARDLGLGEGATPKEVHEACSARLAAASRSRADAIREWESLGYVPSARELSNAFSGLHQQDRRTVLKEIPSVKQLMTEPGRERARPGLSL